MKISRNWLQSYVDLSGLSNDEISRAITLLGFEVEGVQSTGAPQLDNVFVGEVLTRDKHPNADKLSVCSVDVGPAQGVKRIVCGAQNYKVGDRVPVALVGAVLPGNFVIKQSKIRGESSDGMMCSAKELGVAEDAAGLLILPGRPELGAPINAVLPPGDTVFDIEITPNRPDCLSHLGIARELSAWFKKDLSYPEFHFEPAHAEPTPRADLLKLVRVDSPENCPLYTATVIAGVKIGPSPEWLQQRLLSVGLRPINNVVDVGNFVTLEYGQPVHAFDAKKLAGHSIIVRQAIDGEKLLTLDGKTRTLTERMLVIADAEKPVVIAGIMGGEGSGVSEDTTDLVLEVAYFKRQSIRWTSKRLGLSSDSSYRYERGVDVHSLEEAMHRCIDLILTTAGGKVMGPTYKVGHDVPWQREIVVTPAYINERLGFEITADAMKSALDALELSIVREDHTDDRGPAWTVSIPSWRDDLDRPIDLVEEVLRVHGSDKIPATVVTSPGLLVDDDVIVNFNRAVTDTLVGQSFNECVTYTLRPLKETTTVAPESAVPGLALANPFLEDQSHLRATLIPGLLESLKLNQDRGVAVSRLFETGRVFLERNGQMWECAAVGFILCENEKGRAGWLRREPADFYTVKRLTEAVAAAAGVDLARQPIAPVAAPTFGWQEGHAADAGVSSPQGDSQPLAYGWTARFGLLDLALLKSLGIEGKVYAGLFAILPEKLAAGTARRRYQPFSLLPAALRDLALVVDAATPAADVQKTLAKLARAAAGNAFALESVNVFDVYQGTGLPEGKKSLAFNLIFRSADRTLTDDEVNAAFTKLQDELVRTTPWQIRK